MPADADAMVATTAGTALKPAYLSVWVPGGRL